tara:strand:+ start:183 stop:668 length:486 start_codon:yes stop_codon:yes gene_type:complete
MIRVTDQYFWNIIFILFYLGLVVMGVIVLQSEAYITYAELDLFDIVIIALASQRLIRLFVYDSMTKFFREQFYDAKVTKAGKVTLHKPKTGPRRTLCELVNCSWSFGLWATTMVTFFYLLTPLAFVPVLILALSAVATWLQLFSSMIGWKAEQLRGEVEGK